MTNFEILQEYEKAGVPLPRLEEWQRLKELLKECVVIIGYADTISNNEENKKTIHEIFTKIEEVLR